MAKRSWTKIKQKDIDLAHALKDAGLSINQAKKVLNRGYNTVSDMYKATDIKDYKRIVREYNLQRKAEKSNGEVKPVTAEQLTTVSATVPTEEWQKIFMSQTNAIIALLQAIEYKLTLK
jgi:hypothetical protein